MLFSILAALVFLALMLLVLVGEPGARSLYMASILISFILVAAASVLSKGIVPKIVALPLVVALALLLVRGFSIPDHPAAGFGKMIRVHVTRPFKPFLPIAGVYTLLATAYYVWHHNRRGMTPQSGRRGLTQ